MTDERNDQMSSSRNIVDMQNDVPWLLVDDAVIGSKTGIVRTLHPGCEWAEPVLMADQP